MTPDILAAFIHLFVGLFTYLWDVPKVPLKIKIRVQFFILHSPADSVKHEELNLLALDNHLILPKILD